MANGGGGSSLPARPLQRVNIPVSLLPLVLLATVMSLFVVFTTLKLAVGNFLSEAHSPRLQEPPIFRLPEEVSLALLHFATTPEIPQQSRDEISCTREILMNRGPCNFLVFGMWHDSLLWTTFNYGGRTAFLDESQGLIDKMKMQHPKLEAYKVDYGTTLGEASNLLATSRKLREKECRADQDVAKSSCPLALTTSNRIPRELFSVDWDVIMIDGPRSFHTNLSFPGRMSAIFTASVMARSRAAPGYVDILMHDVSRQVESDYGREFLCMDNLVSSVGDLWHFRVHPSLLHEFCPNSTSVS